MINDAPLYKRAKAAHAEDVAKLHDAGFTGCTEEQYQDLKGGSVKLSTIMINYDDLPGFTKKFYEEKVS